MGDLAGAVLPLIRTRAELWRWRTSNDHGRQMHEAVDILERAAITEPPAEVYAVTTKAIASALTVIMRADDSSGIIGDACRRLLDLHPKIVAKASPPVTKLLDWMIKFQFQQECDYFALDPVSYAPALGEIGMRRYRDALSALESRLGPRPASAERWQSTHSHEWFVLEWNDKRLAVHDRDIDAIVRTHLRDGKVAAWFEDTARALAEIGAMEPAINWAHAGMDVGPSHQSLKVGEYWCDLLALHRPDELLDARAEIFRRWPSSSAAARLHKDAGRAWLDYRDEVMAALASSARDSVIFALLTLKDVELAWELAHSLGLKDRDILERLTKAYEKVDPLAVLPVLVQLVESELVQADARNYQFAARRLKRMRDLASGTDKLIEVDDFIAQLRFDNRRRPRLQLEFDRKGLP